MTINGFYYGSLREMHFARQYSKNDDGLELPIEKAILLDGRSITQWELKGGSITQWELRGNKETI